MTNVFKSRFTLDAMALDKEACKRLIVALRWYQQEVKALKKYREQTNNLELGARTLFIDDGEMAARALEEIKP